MKRTETMVEMVEIDLDKKRNIVLDTEAMLAIEEQLDVNTLDLGFWKNMSTKRARVVLWAGLLYEDPDLKLEEMKTILKGQGLGAIMEKLLEAWGLAKPKTSKGAKGITDPTQPEASQSSSDGKTSGK